jgi:carboxypeptidase family protein/TonB-dependent receptor-like protein
MMGKTCVLSGILRQVFVLALLVAGLFVLQTVAQTVVSGDITGTVTDPTGAVVSGATVTATDVAENTTQSTTTNSAGLYRFPFAKPGAYRLTVSFKGFRGVAETIGVGVGQIAMANFKLELGAATETVEVSGGTLLVQTEDANVSNYFSQLQIAELPAPGGDTTSYAYTTPGIVVSNGAGYGNFSSFGLPSTANLFTVNGNDNNDPFLNVNNSGASNLTLGANELQEISVVNNGYTAQYGRQAGAQINSVTKSGSNGFHGNAFYGYNGTALNANDWFANAATDPVTGAWAPTPRPHAVNNNYYASVGGPIVKNKLFFFADYEALRIVLPGVSGLNYIPSPQFATYVEGNVPAAALPFYQNIFKLYAGAPGSQNATPFPGGGCGSFDGTAGFGTGGTPCALQFTSGQNNLITEWVLATRVDYKISSKDTLFGRYHMDRGVQATGTDPINPVFNATSLQPEYDGQLNETHIFNPTTINNFILGIAWYKALFGPPSFSAAVATFPTTLTFADGAPFVNLGGTDNNYPQGRIPTQYQITDDFSKTTGGHELKAGLNFRRDLVSDYSALTGTSGTLLINSMTEFANGVTAATPASQYTANFTNVGVARINYYSLGAYLQDQWKVTRNLNLTLALRVDRNSNPTCKGCFSRLQGPFGSITHDVNVPYNQVIKTGFNSAFQNVEKAVFSPRFGFAYSLNSKTVIRGGFGIFDDLYPAIAADRFLTNAPNVNSFGSNLKVGSGGRLLAPGTGSVFADAAAANAAFQSGFASGLTVAGLGGPGNGPGYYTMQDNLRNPKFAEWSLDVQRQIGTKYTAVLTYAGNHGYDIMSVNPWLNAYCIACAAGQSFGGVIGTTPTDPRFNEVVDLTNNGYSNYDGLTAAFRVKPTKGLSGQFSYTWSHDLDTCSNNCLEPFVANTLVSLRYQPSPLLPGTSYGNSDYDVRHNFNANYVYQSSTNWSNSALKQLLGGWTLAGTLFYHTGLPWSPVDTRSRSALGNVTPLRNGTPLATFSGAVPSGSCGESAAKAAVGAAGGVPCVTQSDFSVGTLGFGNHARNSMRGPGFFDTDMSLSKGFKITERFDFAIGATAFDVLNHQNFDLPLNNARSSSIGLITSTIGTNTSPYGAFFGVPLNGRILQVHAKFTF